MWCVYTECCYAERVNLGQWGAVGNAQFPYQEEWGEQVINLELDNADIRVWGF